MAAKVNVEQFGKGFGLGLLPPTLRLAIVFVATSSFVWISHIEVGLCAFAASFLFFVLNRRKSFPLLMFLVSITMLSYFFGNLLFSPVGGGGITFWIFRVNPAGRYLGIVGALKRGAMITLSLAWLSCTPLPEMQKSLDFLRPAHRWIGLFLRSIQTVRREFVLLRQSLLIRGFTKEWYQVGQRITELRLMLQAVLFRTFQIIQATTYVGETHRPGSSADSGSIVLSNVSTSNSFHGSSMLDDISLSVPAGQFVFLGGRSNAGTTTLLRIICGYIPRLIGEYHGTVEVCGFDADRMWLSELSKYVRLVPSDVSQSIIGLTVADDILGLAQNETEARKCLRIMGIEHLWRQETTTLSGGEQVRLVLAGILAARIPVVLLESPLEQLDWAGRREFLEALDNLRKHSGLTIIVTDPDFISLKPYVSRFLLMENGRITLDLVANQVDNQVLARAGLRSCESKQSVSGSLVGKSDDSPVAWMSNVKLSIGGREVLRGMSFRIFRSECVVVMGANGSGKTTAFLTLAGVISPSSGSAEVRCDVGYVFQDAALQLVETTASKELELGPTLKKWRTVDIEKFVVNQLAWTQLGPETSPLDLHPAQARLLSIAAMNVSIGVMIFDEPTIGLDEEGVQKLESLVHDLVIEGVTVIIITHDRRILGLGNRLIAIRSGTIVYDGIRPTSAALDAIMGECDSQRASW